ncbi:hypothetical protein MAHJHV60_45670 [Mycobacterium avium subsp. hominissuis]
MLILLPAVDAVDGRAVRLVQGKAGSETEYGSALPAERGVQRRAVFGFTARLALHQTHGAAVLRNWIERL